jgi:hypothetical protein
LDNNKTAVVIILTALGAILLMGIIIIAGAYLLQDNNVDHITCRELTIVGEDGTPVVRLREIKDMGGSIAIHDESGVPIVILGGIEYGGGVYAYNKTGTIVVSLGAIHSGGMLSVKDNADNVVANLP